MLSKIAVLACILAVVNAGAIGVPAVATYAAEPVVASYAAPAYASYAAGPAYTSYAEPTLSATSENTYRSAGNLHTISTQSKTIATPFSSSNKQFTKITNPAVYAQATTYPLAYSAPVAQTYAPAPVAYSAPVAHAAPAAAVAHGASLLGVAYSPAVAVSHMTYNSPTIGYGW